MICVSAALTRIANLAWNASSTSRASAVAKLFLALRIRCAQVVASSAEVMSFSSVRICSRKAAEASGLRVDLGILTLRLPQCFAEVGGRN